MNHKQTVLFLDDDVKLRKSFALDFYDFGLEVVEASTLKEIEEISLLVKIDYAVVDLRLVGESGLNSIELILKKWPSCKVVVLTGYGSISSAVDAIKKGAKDYLTKPVTSEILLDVLRGEKKGEAPEENHPPTLERMEHEYIDFILGRYQGNISQAAKVLGLHRQSLQRKLKKFPNKKEE
jgi:two-component system response regulator RegA